jgi:hypothetical protein
MRSGLLAFWPAVTMQVNSAMTTKRMTAYFIFAVRWFVIFAGNRKDLDLGVEGGKGVSGGYIVYIAGLEQY